MTCTSKSSSSQLISAFLRGRQPRTVSKKCRKKYIPPFSLIPFQLGVLFVCLCNTPSFSPAWLSLPPLLYISFFLNWFLHDYQRSYFRSLEIFSGCHHQYMRIYFIKSSSGAERDAVFFLLRIYLPSLVNAKKQLDFQRLCCYESAQSSRLIL